MKKIRLSGTGIFLAISLALLAGCQSVRNTGDGSAPYELRGTDWMLIEIAAGPDQVAQEVSPNQYLVTFTDEGRASFRLACNRASGVWQTNQTGSSGTLTFSQVAVTSALCPGDQIGEVLAQDIVKVTKFTIYDGRLTMESGNDGKIYVWDKVD